MESTWIATQKKAFARWANHVLRQRGLAINDIDHDLRTGSTLIALVEILSSEAVSPRRSNASSNTGGSKIQSFTNATRALKFIEGQGINLVNCLPEHIVDNNSKMVLGLLWRVITHYHIQPLITEDDLVRTFSDSGSKTNVFEGASKSLRIKALMTKSARDALLRWCKNELETYNINISNFTKSFQSPSVLAALVHKQDSSIINLEDINTMEPAMAFAKIFEISETQLGIPKILDPSDFIDASGTDESSVMLYIAYFLKRGNPIKRAVPRTTSQEKERSEACSLDTLFKEIKRQIFIDTHDICLSPSNYLREVGYISLYFLYSSKNELNIQLGREEVSEELHAENSRLRSENRMLKEFIKTELEKTGATMETNMKNTVQKVDTQAAILVAKVQTIKSSLDRLASFSATSSADNRRLRSELDETRRKHQEIEEARRKQQDQPKEDREDVHALREAISTISKLHAEVAELRTEAGKVEGLRAQLTKMEELRAEAAQVTPLRTEMTGLRRDNEHLRLENKTLQKHVTDRGLSPRGPVSVEIRQDDNSSIHIDDSDELSQHGDEKERVKEPQVKVRASSTKIFHYRSKSTTTPDGNTPGNTAAPSKRKAMRAHLKDEALRTAHVIIVQSVVRRWLGKRQAKRARGRRTVAAEIVSTEKTHVASLQTLLSEYFQPLRKMAAEGQPISSTLNENLLKTIFNNAEVIYNINSNLLAKLEQRWQKWTFEQKLGDVFLSTIEFLKCYNQYVNHYNRSLDALAECSKITPFANFLKTKAIKCGHHLRDLLIIPVQRIPRYVIMLEQLVRYTHASHPDFKELTLALAKMRGIADYVNEKKRDFEALAQVSSIQETLVGISILEYPRLRFLIEGELVIEGGKKTQQYHVFLFNEIILCAKLLKKVFGDRKQKQVKYKFLELIKITPEMKIQRGECSFSIELPTGSKKFTTTTEKDRDVWITNIQSSVDKMIEAKRTKSVDHS